VEEPAKMPNAAKPQFEVLDFRFYVLSSSGYKIFLFFMADFHE
jgi:hypothetical protein